MNTNENKINVKEKPIMETVEEEIHNLKEKIKLIQVKTHNLLKNISSKTELHAGEDTNADADRPHGSTRFEEMRIILKETCNNDLCSQIIDDLEKITDMI